MANRTAIKETIAANRADDEAQKAEKIKAIEKELRRLNKWWQKAQRDGRRYQGQLIEAQIRELSFQLSALQRSSHGK